MKERTLIASTLMAHAYSGEVHHATSTELSVTDIHAIAKEVLMWADIFLEVAGESKDCDYLPNEHLVRSFLSCLRDIHTTLNLLYSNFPYPEGPPELETPT